MMLNSTWWCSDVAYTSENSSDSCVCVCVQVEARSVEHIKKVAKGLENKIIELQQRLDDKVRKPHLAPLWQSNTHIYCINRSHLNENIAHPLCK